MLKIGQVGCKDEREENPILTFFSHFVKLLTKF